MKALKLTTLTLALAATFAPIAQADIGQEVLDEIKAMKARIVELERRLQDSEAKVALVQPGMTAEERAEFNRIAVKAEAIEDAREASALQGMKFSGYMDPTYIYNANQHRAGFQFLNPVSDDLYNYDNSYFGAAVLDIQKEMEGGTRWRLTLAPNRGVGSVFQGNDSPIHEASVSVPLGDLQTRFIAGQIPDWSGYEYLQPTLNKLITHNLLFDFTLPVAYTGAGMELIRGKWWSKVMLANMNASKRNAGEKSPVLAYRVDYSKGEFQGFGFAGVHGKAVNLRALDSTTASGLAANPVSLADYSGADTDVNLFEADAYFIRGDWTLQGQLSYGTQKKAADMADPVTGDLRDASWWGASALAAYKFTPQLEGIARIDYINNKKNGGGLLGYWADARNGVGHNPNLTCDFSGGTGSNDAGCDTGANRTALALGINYRYNLNTTFKVEYRIDRASQPVFEDTGAPGTFKKSNTLLGTSVVVSF